MMDCTIKTLAKLNLQESKDPALIKADPLLLSKWISMKSPKRLRDFPTATRKVTNNEALLYSCKEIITPRFLPKSFQSSLLSIQLGCRTAQESSDQAFVACGLEEDKGKGSVDGLWVLDPCSATRGSF